MFKPRVYVDTSVIGGCIDDEFKEYSCKLFEGIISGQRIVVIFDLILFELESAPKRVRDVIDNISDDNIEYVFLNSESIDLANNYLNDRAIAQNCLSDARHIAIATVERVDILISWNFKHIVNLNRIRKVNSINLKLGYPILEIRSPREVLYEG